MRHPCDESTLICIRFFSVQSSSIHGRREQDFSFFLAKTVTLSVAECSFETFQEMAQVRPFGGAENSKDDSIPRPGTVQNACRQWSVHEDEGLAHRLQEGEFKTHFTRNKEYHRTVQGDIKEAKKTHGEELAEVERSHARHVEQLMRLEERDRVMAESLQGMILEEEAEIQHRRRQRDQALALALQEEERAKSERQPPSQTRASEVQPGPSEDFVFEAPVRPPRRSAASTGNEHTKRLQELEDAELARRLQDEEETQASRDYRLAMESQDAEYAQVLAEKEKERLRRLKEKHKAQRELSNQQEPAALTPSPGEIPAAFRSHSPDAAERLGIIMSRDPQSLDNNLRRYRAQHEAEAARNVVTAIDPTYRPRSGPEYAVDQSGSRSPGTWPTEQGNGYGAPNGPTTPPMPVIGERRVSSLEKVSRPKSNRGVAEQGGDKNGKQKDKDCKTQ